jgi:hypothetical protein
VIGLDFGTTYSGFSYCHVNEPENMNTNDSWPGCSGQLKTNTVLQYDDEYNNVKLWGYSALYERPSRRNRRQNSTPVELFKLHLSNLPHNLKLELPVDYKKAITDYLKEIGKVLGQSLPNYLYILLI